MKYNGIDISQWQEGLDYDVMAQSLDFVILREGYRKTQDKMFITHLKGFQNAGVPVIGVYHFLYALNVADAKAEAQNCIKNVQAAGLPKTTQIWCDFEYDTIGSAAKKGVLLGTNEVNSFTVAFCDTVIAAGYPTGVYTNMDYYNNYYTQKTLKKYPIWLADLKENPSVDCLIHQYSWEGKISGYSETLDMDYYYGELFDEIPDYDAVNDTIAEEATELKRGSTGNEVKEMQKKLQSIGYVIAVDGDFGANTEKIVKQFQTKYGLLVDGIAGINTLSKLDDVVASMTKSTTSKDTPYTSTINVTSNVTNTLSIPEKATRWMEDLANDDSHGYDQIYRWGERGDYDCSSAVISAYRYAGLKLESASYTGNMLEAFLAEGFVKVDKSKINFTTGEGLQRGDVLLNIVHHVAISCGGNKECEASINERGGATYGTPGDQTGREILIKNLRDYPWDVILRYTGQKSTTSTLLKRGSKGEAVKDLQQKLVVLGYSLDTDGDFGNATEKVVKQFQKKYSLEVDGIVGSKTMDKIDSLITEKDIDNIQESITNVKPQYVGKVTANKLNVRSGPGTSYGNIKSYPYLEYGNLIDVCDTIGDWLYIRINGNIYGYVSASYVSKA